MQISTKTGYAVRALAELAGQPAGTPVSISAICRRQNLPPKYIEQLFRKLKHSKLISSKHGARGGYLLSRPASQLSLKDIMEAVEDDFSGYCCLGANSHIEYCQGSPCVFYDFWNDIRKHQEEYFSSLKLDQVMKLQETENEANISG